jgi:hypothetical protein
MLDDYSVPDDREPALPTTPIWGNVGTIYPKLISLSAMGQERFQLGTELLALLRHNFRFSPALVRIERTRLLDPTIKRVKEDLPSLLGSDGLLQRAPDRGITVRGARRMAPCEKNRTANEGVASHGGAEG